MRSPRRKRSIVRRGRVSLPTPVLRYSEEPDRSREESGSSEYLRTGVGGEKVRSHVFADAGAAAVMPANTSMAKLLASHVLRDGEVVLLVLRPSLWFIPISSIRFVAAALLLILGVRFFGAQSMSSHGAVRSLVEFGVSAISARLMWATLQWMSRLYILTDLRVLILAGVFNVSIFDCPLRKIARTRVIRNNPERITGVGSIEIIPQDDSLPFGLWQTIAQPVAVHEQMVSTINRAKQ